MNEEIIKTAEPFITDYDRHLFKEGKHFKLYEKLGARPMIVDGQLGVHFAVWAPNAKKVSVIGNFNNEVASRFGSIVWDLNFEWQDAQWMKGRCKNNSLDAPFSIYEMHIGSWR